MLFYEEPLYKEPTYGMLKYFEKAYTTKGKFPKELFNLKKFYNTKQSRIRKLVPFIFSQGLHRLFAMNVLSPSLFIDLTLQPKLKAKRTSPFYLFQQHFYDGTNCMLKIKELLRNFTTTI